MSEKDLDLLRINLRNDLEKLHTRIDQCLFLVKNENIKQLFELLIERQDRLFEYYVSSREEIIQKQNQKITKSIEKPKNAFTDCMDLLF